MSLRILPALAIASAALLVAGCSATPGSTVPSSTADAGETPTPGGAGVVTDDIEAAWLDHGRGFAVLTWGSSSCTPVIDDVTAEGQNVRVVLAASGEKACTDDLVPRGVFAGVPDGVDVTAPVAVQIVAGERVEDLALDALAEVPSPMTDHLPSAGWFEHGGAVALLTWGSSTCPPIVSGVEASETGATVTFETVDRMCTMDLVPRVTPIILPEAHDGGAFELTLTGDDLDATVPVLP